MASDNNNNTVIDRVDIEIFKRRFDDLTATRPNLISNDVDKFIRETSNPAHKFREHYLFYNREAITIAFEFFRKMFYSLFSLTTYNATVVNHNTRSQSMSFSPGSYSMTMKSLKRVVPYLNEFPLESPLHYKNIVKNLKDNFNSKTPIGDADIFIQKKAGSIFANLYGLLDGPDSKFNSTGSERAKLAHMKQIINSFVVPFFDYVLDPFMKLFESSQYTIHVPPIYEEPYSQYFKNRLSESDILICLRNKEVDSSQQISNNDLITFIEVKQKVRFSSFSEPEAVDGVKYCKANFGNLDFLGVVDPSTVDNITTSTLKKNLQKFQEWTSIYRQLCSYAIFQKVKYFILSDAVTTVLLMIDFENLTHLYQDQRKDGNRYNEFDTLQSTFPEIDKWDLNNTHSQILSDTINVVKRSHGLNRWLNGPLLRDPEPRYEDADRITGYKDVTTVPFRYSVFHTEEDEVPLQTAICAILNGIANLTREERGGDSDWNLLYNRIRKDVNSSENVKDKENTSNPNIAKRRNPQQEPQQATKRVKRVKTSNIHSSKRSHKILTYNFGDEVFICDSLNGVRVNKQGMIGEAIQCSANRITKTFAIGKDDMMKCFPQLKMLNEGCFPDKLLLKVYDDQHIDEVFEWDDYYGTKTDLLRDVPEHYFAETTILRTLKIENRNKDSMKVPDLYGYGMIKFEPNDSPKAKPFKGLFILMEYIEPDKKQLKSILKGTNKDLKKKYYNQILAQLKLIHKSYIYHLDIAARNIVISKNNAYLIDFSHSDFNAIYASTKDVDDLNKLFNFPDF